MKMFNKKLLPFGLVTVCLTMIGCSAQREERSSDTIFPAVDITAEVEDVAKLTDLFPSHRLVHLETNDSSLIGGDQIKILKRDSAFYIRSYNDIIVFDNDGKFVGKLSKIGQNRDEYTAVLDFDVATIGDRKEILIASHKKIKRYDAQTFEFIGEIDNKDFVNQLYFVNDSSLITVSPSDIVMNVIDLDGNVRKSFLEKDVANSSFSPLQFRKLADGRIAYKLDLTNEAVVYDPVKDEFNLATIMPQTGNLLTVENNREYYKQFGYRGMAKKTMQDFIWVSSVQTKGDDYIITCFHPGGKKTVTIGDGDEAKTYVYSENSANLSNDLPTNDMRLLSTLICCDSDDAFLFMIEGDDFVSDEVIDSNPVLLEVSAIQI